MRRQSEFNGPSVSVSPSWRSRKADTCNQGMPRAARQKKSRPVKVAARKIFSRKGANGNAIQFNSYSAGCW